MQSERGITVNWHITNACNYKCIFCFGKHSCSNELWRNPKKSIKMLQQVYNFFSRRYDYIKITFSGGEPFLCKNLGFLVKYCKEIEFAVGIITNGSLVTREWITKWGQYIDQFGVSLDSASNEIEKQLGRGYGDHVDKVIETCELVRTEVSHVRLKINTVVTKLNYKEDMTEIILQLRPDRWKVFQVVIMKNVPTEIRSKLEITEEQFMEFVRRHKKLNPIAETCEDSRESYIMIDPCGRFYYRTKDGGHKYSEPILSIGVEKAFKQVRFDYEKFCKRGGNYRV